MSKTVDWPTHKMKERRQKALRAWLKHRRRAGRPVDTEHTEIGKQVRW